MSGFTDAANRYGADNLKQAVALVDWYTGTLYPQATGQAHEEMSRGKTVTFATKILDFMRETGSLDATGTDAPDWALMQWVLEQAAMPTGTDPTIYLVTSPKVLGYHLMKHPELGWEFVSGTDYQPVDDYY